MDDDDLEYEVMHPSYPWSWKTAAVYCGDFVSTILSAGAMLVQNISVELAASVNHDTDQRTFRDQVVRDIESINTLEE